MKTYEVLVKAYTTVIVNADNDEHALEIAAEHSDLSSPSGWEIDEWTVERELKTPEDVERHIRHSVHHESENRDKPYTDH